MATATLTRWWTPEGKVPVAKLLAPGPDPAKDLGLALFALHKAGAEACELVARTAVADEMVLATALAETRAAVAPAAVGTVAKAVESPQYAGLLLADLLDDAESAALSLYRSCLAKSVAPPIAAQRVGMVFGVPSRSLGRYSALATDPKASPVAVQDAADRALFDHVAKVVAEEYVPAKELVSKAPQPRSRDPKDLDAWAREQLAHDHGGSPRDYHGREPGERNPQSGEFQRVRGAEVVPGVSLQDLFDAAEKPPATQSGDADRTPPPVGTRTTEQTPGPAVGTTPRTVRSLRSQKSLKSLKSQRSVQSASSQSQMQPALGRQLRPALSPQLTERGLRAQNISIKQAPPPVPLTGHQRPVPDLLNRRPPGPEGELDETISFVLVDNEYEALRRNATQKVDGSFVLRQGGLAEYAGDAHRFEDEQGNIHAEHRSVVNDALTTLMGSEDYQGQPTLIVGSVPMSFLDADTEGAREKLLNEAKDDFLREEAMKLGLTGFNVVNERTNVRPVPSKEDPNGTMMLLWRPPSDDPRTGRRRAQRPIPGIVEIKVGRSLARGKKSPDGRIEVDPNAVLSMKGIRSAVSVTDPYAKVTVWDSQLGAIVTTVEARPGNPDDVHKAITPDDPSTPRFDGRDTTSGQYASERTRAKEPSVDLQALFDQARARHSTPSSTRSLSSARQARSLRSLRSVSSTARPQLQPQVKPQVKPRLDPRLKAQTQARQLLRANKGKELVPSSILWLDDDTEYGVIPPGVMFDMAQEDNLPGFVEHRSTPWTLGPQARDYLLRFGKGKVGGTAENELETHTLNAWNEVVEGEEPDAPEEQPLVSAVITSDAHLLMAAETIAAKMEADPSISVVRAEFRRRPNGQVALVTYGNRRPLPTQHILRYSSAASVDRPRRLVPGATQRMKGVQEIKGWLEIVQHSMDQFGGTQLAGAEDTLANPKVKNWHVE